MRDNLKLHLRPSILTYFDQAKQANLKAYVKIDGLKSKFQVIPHTPSFILLKDTVKNGDMEVFKLVIVNQFISKRIKRQ